MLAAALTLLLASGLVASTVSPVTAAEEEVPGQHRSTTILDGKKGLRGGDVFTSRNGWGLSTHPLRQPCIGCLQSTPLRERVPGKGWATPRNLPASVYVPHVQVQRTGSAWITYVHAGSIWVAEKTPAGKRLPSPIAVAPWTGTLATGGPQPRLVVGDGPFTGTWSDLPVGVVWAETSGVHYFTERLDNGTWSAPSPLPFQDQPTPESNGWYAPSLIDFMASGELLMMWHRDGIHPGTWYATRDASTGTWAEPQLFSPAGRIRPLAVDGDVLVFEAGRESDYNLRTATFVSHPDGPDEFLSPRRIDGNNTGRYDVRVFRDDYQHLTIAWADGNGRYPMLWSPDRPGGNIDAGTRILGNTPVDSWDLVTTPAGNLGFAYTLANQNTKPPVIRLRYLPAHKNKNAWTRPAKIATDDSRDSTAALLGDHPTDVDDHGTGAITLRLNTRNGATAHTFTHPEPVTAITGPARTQTANEYMVSWTTTWGVGARWSMRFTTTRRGTDGWQRTHGWVTGGPKESQWMSHVRNGETRCFQVRTWIYADDATPWSASRCITVRR